MPIVECPKCRARLPSEAEECTYCGTQLIHSGYGEVRTGPDGRSCGPLSNLSRTMGCTAGCLVFLALLALMAFLGNLKACQMFSPFRQAIEERLNE